MRIEGEKYFFKVFFKKRNFIEATFRISAKEFDTALIEKIKGFLSLIEACSKKEAGVDGYNAG